MEVELPRLLVWVYVPLALLTGGLTFFSIWLWLENKFAPGILVGILALCLFLGTLGHIIFGSLAAFLAATPWH